MKEKNQILKKGIPLLKSDEEPGSKRNPVDKRYRKMLHHSLSLNLLANDLMTIMKELIDTKSADGELGPELRAQAKMVYRTIAGKLENSREELGDQWFEIVKLIKGEKRG